MRKQWIPGPSFFSLARAEGPGYEARREGKWSLYIERGVVFLGEVVVVLAILGGEIKL